MSKQASEFQEKSMSLVYRGKEIFKPMNTGRIDEREIKQCSEKIAALKQQVEDLIMDRIHDREHLQIYNDMISKREEEIAECEKRIAELREYDKTCKQKKEQLKSTSELIEKILSEGTISDVNLRMLVKRITIHQNEDRSIDIRIEMNGAFDANMSVFLKSA